MGGLLADDPSEERVDITNQTVGILSELSALIKGAVGQGRLGEYVFSNGATLCFQAGLVSRSLKFLGEGEKAKMFEDICSEPMTQQTAVSLSKLAQSTVVFLDSNEFRYPQLQPSQAQEVTAHQKIVFKLISPGPKRVSQSVVTKRRDIERSKRHGKTKGQPSGKSKPLVAK